jgi:hypothetical protein
MQRRYCIFIWLSQTRTIWLLSILGLPLGIAIIMGLWLFAAVMIVLNLSAFGTYLPPLPLVVQKN